MLSMQKVETVSNLERKFLENLSRVVPSTLALEIQPENCFGFQNQINKQPYPMNIDKNVPTLDRKGYSSLLFA
jgi:hypothetical protein